MKKITAIILSICACTAFALPKTETFFAQIKSATAEPTVSKQSLKTEMIAPSSYEQYLSLSAPTDVAVTKDYTAIADDNVIYVFDREDNLYRQYTHTVNNENTKNTVTKLQFDQSDNLYFLDASTYLYILNPKAIRSEEKTTATETGFVFEYLFGDKSAAPVAEEVAATEEVAEEPATEAVETEEKTEE